MEQRLMAFWKYDLPPYVLAGEIIEFTSNGNATIKGYCSFQCFKPIKILPYDNGVEVKAKIEELGREYRLKEAALKAEMKNSVNELLGD